MFNLEDLISVDEVHIVRCSEGQSFGVDIHWVSDLQPVSHQGWCGRACGRIMVISPWKIDQTPRR